MKEERQEKRHGTKVGKGIWDLGEGQHRVRVYSTNPKTGKPKELERIVRAKTVNQAEQARDRLQRQARDGGPVSRQRKRVGDVSNDWLAKKLKRVRSDGTPYLCPSTRERYTPAVDNHIAPYFGDYYVDQLTEEDVEDWQENLLASGYAASTINGHHRILRQILGRTECRAAHEVPMLPEDDIRTTEDEPNLLDPAELTHVLKLVKEDAPQHYPLVLVLVVTGMRISCALALRWEDRQG